MIIRGDAIGLRLVSVALVARTAVPSPAGASARDSRHGFHALSFFSSVVCWTCPRLNTLLRVDSARKLHITILFRELSQGIFQNFSQELFPGGRGQG